MINDLEKKFRQKFEGVDDETLDIGWSIWVKSIFADEDPKGKAQRLTKKLDVNNFSDIAGLTDYIGGISSWIDKQRKELGELDTMPDMEMFNPNNYTYGTGQWWKDLHKELNEGPFTDFMSFLNTQKKDD